MARAIEAFVGAVIVVAFLNAMSSLPNFPWYIPHLVTFAMVAGTLLMIRDIQFWNHAYAFGWLLGLPIGIYLMVASGVISVLDVIVYLFVTVAGFYIKYLATSNSRKRVMA